MINLPLANLQLWVTPLWMISLGGTLAALILLALYGVLWLVSRSAATRVRIAVQEGVLMPLSYVLMAMIAICILAAPTIKLDRIIDSVQRLAYVGEKKIPIVVPPQAEDQEAAVSFRAEELTSYGFESDQDLRIAAEPGQAYSGPLAVVEGDEPYVWTPSSKFARGLKGDVTTLYITNEGDAPANLTLSYATDVRVPEVHHLPITIGAVLGVYLFYLLLQWLLPGIGNISTATAKEAMGQPLFLLFLLLGGFALVAYIYVPYNTFGEDVKMLKDSGLSTIMVLSIIFALWTASTSIADEIEGKTALTLLSKPISRRQFILGKFAGIVWPVLVLFVVLGSILMATVSYKVVYDSRETSNPTPQWEECYAEMVQIVPGLVLSFLEAVVLTAISVAISTRLPMLPNLVICGSIYVLGHLGALIVASGVGQIEFVAFIGKLIAVVVPVLDHFNIQAAIAGGVSVPPGYLLWATLYCILYSTFAMLLALILFEDRDLA